MTHTHRSRPAVRLGRALVAAALAAALSAAAADLHTIDLRHRTAESIVGDVRALADDGVTVIPDGTRLLVRGTEAQVASVRNAAQRLDQPAQRVRISVRSGEPTQLRREGIGVGDDGLRIRGTRQRDRRDTEQTVTGIAGEPLRISSGEERGRTRSRLILGGSRPGVGESREYVTAERGFYARPQIHGDTVTVTLAATRQAFGDRGERAGSDVTTTVTGPLGEWLRVASSGTTRESDRSSIAGDDGRGARYSTRRSDEGTVWWLRVERIGR